MLFRRRMRAPRNIEPPPEFMAQVHDLMKSNTREQNAAIVRAIHDAEAAINRKLEKIMAKLDELLDAVASQQTQIDSLVTLASTIRDQVVAAMGSTITPSQQMRIDQVFDAVKENADDITRALKENTPEATAGAVSGGQSFGEINRGLKPDPTGTGSAFTGGSNLPDANAPNFPDGGQPIKNQPNGDPRNVRNDGGLGSAPSPAAGSSFTDPVFGPDGQRINP